MGGLVGSRSAAKVVLVAFVALNVAVYVSGSIEEQIRDDPDLSEVNRVM